MSLVYLTRQETFCACHRLHSKELTDEENIKIYGKCNHPNGHGHNYTVHITICGPVDKKTGMVMNITDLTKLMKEVIMDKLDHKNLDMDVDYFKNVPSTTENLALYIWLNMQYSMEKPELLYEVKIDETAKNSVIFRGSRQQRALNGGIQFARKKNDSCTNISSDSD